MSRDWETIIAAARASHARTAALEQSLNGGTRATVQPYLDILQESIDRLEAAGKQERALQDRSAVSRFLCRRLGWHDWRLVREGWAGLSYIRRYTCRCGHLYGLSDLQSHGRITSFKSWPSGEPTDG